MTNPNPPNEENKLLNEDEEAELAALDAMLAEENPELENELNELNELKTENLEGVVDDFEEAHKTKTKDKLIRLFFNLKSLARIWAFNIYYFLKKISIRLAKTLKSNLASFFKWFFGVFKVLTLKQKLQLIAIIITVSAIPFASWFLLTQVFHFKPRGTVTDLSMYADSMMEISPRDTYEDFYRSSRTPPNLLMIERFVVNLKPDNTRLPMMAAELFIESLNPHALAEIKQRESYFRDVIHGFSKNWTFAELDSREGKEKYLQALKEELQSSLRQGTITRILFKTIILKP